MWVCIWRDSLGKVVGGLERFGTRSQATTCLHTVSLSKDVPPGPRCVNMPRLGARLQLARFLEIAHSIARGR